MRVWGEHGAFSSGGTKGNFEKLLKLLLDLKNYLIKIGSDQDAGSDAPDPASPARSARHRRTDLTKSERTVTEMGTQ